VAEDYQFGRCDLDTQVASQAPYSDGIWIDWGTTGKGTSSAFAEFNMSLSGRGVEVDHNFEVNTTTTAIVSGNFTQVNNQNKLVTCIVNILNEGKPSLAGTITIFYLQKQIWEDASMSGDYSRRARAF